ncbi:MAG TPA: nucleotide sugar dehydrogenase [Candidatus Saccharimonadaceae bacterium]|nr:nucleotide sugar dehydrogenase [Candidatus Saccharimonadaceae bacterium]
MTKIKSVAVVGLGYVGLPLALLADKKAFSVYGLDIDQKKIDTLLNDKSYIGDVDDKIIKQSNITFSSDFSLVAKSDAVIICVPTPVTHDKQPDLTPVKGAVASVAPHLQDGTLVVIESTINPGVCDDIVAPLLEKLTGKKIGSEILLAHCPERINPGDEVWNVSNINRVVGANSAHELKFAVELYKKLIDAEVKPMGSLKEAEAVKVVENSFRDINIAFVNELAMSFHKLGINIENVIDGAATKPFAFMPHRPGAGVGGHCIPVDPYYLIEYAHSYGFEHDFLRLARNINEGMPKFTVDLLIDALNEAGKPLKGTKIALLGLSYKPNVGDSRESPAYVIKDLLEQAEATISIYDPFVLEESNVSSIDEALDGAAAVLIATGHNEYKNITAQLLSESGVDILIDGRNLLKNQKNELVRQGINYVGVGI